MACLKRVLTGDVKSQHKNWLINCPSESKEKYTLRSSWGTRRQEQLLLGTVSHGRWQACTQFLRVLIDSSQPSGKTDALIVFSTILKVDEQAQEFRYFSQG